jgi:hypothetical protein
MGEPLGYDEMCELARELGIALRDPQEVALMKAQVRLAALEAENARLREALTGIVSRARQGEVYHERLGGASFVIGQIGDLAETALKDTP